MAITTAGPIPQTGINGSGMMQPQPFQPNFGWGPAGVNGGNNLTGGAVPPQSGFINNPGTPVNNGVTGNSGNPLLGGVLGGLFGPGGAQIGQGLTGSSGSTNAANALNAGYGNMINQQSNLFGGIQNLYNPYTSTGSAATTGLKNLFGGGANGGAPDYSAFQNTPGLGFLESQGSQAINRNAAATGGLYNPSTMTALSNYNIGTANSYAYQPYVNMLMQAAGLGSNATQGVANAGLTTGQNIGQGYVGQGAANASGILGASGAQQSTLGGLSNLLGGILGGGGNNGVLGNALQNWLGTGNNNSNPNNPSSLFNPSNQGLLNYNPSVPGMDQYLGGNTPFTSPESSLTGLGGGNYFGSLGGGAAPGMGAGTYLPPTADSMGGYFGNTDMTGGLGSYSSGGGSALGDVGGGGAAAAAAYEALPAAAPAAAPATTAALDTSTMFNPMGGYTGAYSASGAGPGGSALGATDTGAPAGAGLATLGYGAAFGAGAYALDKIFENNSQANNYNLGQTNLTNAAGLTALANDPNNPYASSDAQAAQAWAGLASDYQSGLINPNANPNVGYGPADYSYGQSGAIPKWLLNQA